MSSVVFNPKNRILVLLIFSITLPLSNSPVYAEWTVVEPPHVSGNWVLNDVHFISTNEGWAVGTTVLENGDWEGVLLHYYNGSWTSVAPPLGSLNCDLQAVYFTSSNEGWAVGDNGTSHTGVLLHYSHGSWKFVSPPKVNSQTGYPIWSWSLSKVHFTSSGEGWAVGSVTTCVSCNPYTGVELYATDLLLHYTNGSWKDESPGFNYPAWSDWLNDVYFTSSGEGWAVGHGHEGGLLLHYSKGEWKSIGPPKECLGCIFSGIHFISPNEGWVVGQNTSGDFPYKGALLHYSNASWTFIDPPDIDAGSSWGLSGVYFTSLSEGWAVGGSVMLHYQNGSWLPVTLPDVSPYQLTLYRICFPSPGEGWAVGEISNQNGDQFRGFLLKFSLPETISIPSNPSGEVNGIIGKSYKYSTGGSSSNLGHTIQYQFDWMGNGSNLSSWGSATQSRTWTNPGIYNVRARARCSQDTSIVSNWSDSLPVSISVPNISIAPTSNDFGNVKVKRSKTASFKVANSGTANLLILATSITGADAPMFTITSGGGNRTIKPGKTLTIKVGFKPTSTGSKTSTLRITSNDSDTPTIDILLSGIGQ